MKEQEAGKIRNGKDISSTKETFPAGGRNIPLV